MRENLVCCRINSETIRFKGKALAGAALVHENEVIRAALFSLAGPEPPDTMVSYRARRRHFYEQRACLGLGIPGLFVHFYQRFSIMPEWQTFNETRSMKMVYRTPNGVPGSPALTGTNRCRGIIRVRDHHNRFARIGSGYAALDLEE
jgi:hypothetical protein